MVRRAGSGFVSGRGFTRAESQAFKKGGFSPRRHRFCRWSFSERQSRNKSKAGSEADEKANMYKGNLIEDLFATVERVELRAQDAETAEIETWFAATEENTGYESNLPGVA
jgi:hypothetical protein